MEHALYEATVECMFSKTMADCLFISRCCVMCLLSGQLNTVVDLW